MINKYTICLAVFATLVVIIASDNRFCHMNSCSKYGKVHTLCKHPTSKPSRACGTLHKSKLTAKEKQDILNAHNKFRKFVASGKEKRGQGGPQPAGIIPPLKWDDNLAFTAQRWAIQCDWKHDSCRNDDRYQVGQNLAKKSGTNGYFNNMYNRVLQWYDEVELYNPRNVKKVKFTKETGHYTQLVWGKTTHVGCGIANYYVGKKYVTYLVCNYGPSGNFPGEAVYKTR
ncbi:venom allergen 5-like [Aphidius gifuensis]|nr:venom allergen 5-like [Aphidius gifuensis]